MTLLSQLPNATVFNEDAMKTWHPGPFPLDFFSSLSSQLVGLAGIVVTPLHDPAIKKWGLYLTFYWGFFLQQSSQGIPSIPLRLIHKELYIHWLSKIRNTLNILSFAGELPKAPEAFFSTSTNAECEVKNHPEGGKDEVIGQHHLTGPVKLCETRVLRL